jgi:four helix bundle protein
MVGVRSLIDSFHPSRMLVNTHRDLTVWQKSIELCAAVYSATRSFPPIERFGLTAQARRAAVSIASNIAEGAARSSPREFARFLFIARGSLAELETQLEIARRCQIWEPNPEIEDLCKAVGRMLNGLIRSLQR